MSEPRLLNELRKKLVTGLTEAAVTLDDALVEQLDKALQIEEKSSAAAGALAAIIENLRIAKTTGLPMCQDTGMIVAHFALGPESPFTLHQLENTLHEAIKEASQQGHFRSSVVNDPLYERHNTKNNLPPIVHFRTMKSGSLIVDLMLKGFGCENCSAVRMLNPTASEDDVIAAVREIVELAQGKPCPPIVIGIGLGGTMEEAALLSKRALFRQVGDFHQNPKYAALETKILAAVNELNIGAGGFGGAVTALWAAIETSATHIAGLPLAVTIGCWADRKARICWGGDDE